MRRAKRRLVAVIGDELFSSPGLSEAQRLKFAIDNAIGSTSESEIPVGSSVEVCVVLVVTRVH